MDKDCIVSSEVLTLDSAKYVCSIHGEHSSFVSFYIDEFPQYKDVMYCLPCILNKVSDCKEKVE